jgi:hypothetical protein
MSVKVKIKHLKPGTVFNAGPAAVRVVQNVHVRAQMFGEW